MTDNNEQSEQKNESIQAGQNTTEQSANGEAGKRNKNLLKNAKNKIAESLANNTVRIPSGPGILPDFSSTDLYALDEAICTKIFEGLSHSGFNPGLVRYQFMSKARGDWKAHLNFLMIMYIQIGNRPDKLTSGSGRLMNSRQVEQCASLIHKYGISKKSTAGGPNGDSLTLPRLAIAFSPVLLKIRTVLQSKLEKVVPDSALPVEHQDPALLGLLSTMGSRESDLLDFHIKFGRLVNPNSERSDAEESKWFKTICNGARADSLTSDEQAWQSFYANPLSELAKQRERLANSNSEVIMMNDVHPDHKDEVARSFFEDSQ